MHCQRAELPLQLTNSAAAKAFFASCLRDCDPAEESLFVAHLDGEARCLHLSRHRGTAWSADFPLREIISDVAIHRTTCLILAHNHPSGNALPSKADCRLTARLASVAEAMDCSVLDHLVFGGERCTSFRQMGLI